MKHYIATSLVLCHLAHSAVSTLLRRQESGILQVSAATPGNQTNKSAESITQNPLIAIVAGSQDQGDYYTEAFTGESIGDPKRGTGACVAFRRTLQCNPSGIRDMRQDKGCQQVVTAEESGFCECGDYAQFAAVNCDHRPFTCEVMCLKYAIVSGRQAVFRGNNLTRDEAVKVANEAMWSNQTDLYAMKSMVDDIQKFMGDAMKKVKDQGANATASMKKFMDMMKVGRKADEEAAAKALAEYRKNMNDKPWLGIWNNGKFLEKTGKDIQAKVAEVLPFDPTTQADSHAVAWAMNGN